MSCNSSHIIVITKFKLRAKIAAERDKAIIVTCRPDSICKTSQTCTQTKIYNSLKKQKHTNRQIPYKPKYRFLNIIFDDNFTNSALCNSKKNKRKTVVYADQKNNSLIV